LQIEKLTKNTVNKRADLENVTTEAQARQIELDRTADEFRALHAQRQQLVSVARRDRIDQAARRGD